MMTSGSSASALRDADALALSAGELLRVLVDGLRAETDEIQQPPHPRGAVVLRGVQCPVGAPRLGDDVTGRHPGVQRGVGVLEHHLHAAPELEQILAAQAERIDAVEADGAGLRTLEHHQGAGQRRLATAGFADESERLATGQVEADAVQRTQFCRSPSPAGYPERLAQVAHGKQLVRHS